MRLKNINGYLISSLTLREAIEKEQQKIIASGLLLPKNKISRNGVMYDWESIKDTYNQIKGLKLMYNHETEGLEANPIGHATKVWLKEDDDAEGIAGLYYEADLDPEHPKTRKILRGDLDNVSLQINAKEVIPKYDANFGEYQLAKVSDWLEFSVVPVPGMKDATIEARIAEAYKKKVNLKEDHMKVGDVVDAGGKKMQVSQVLDSGYVISYLNETESIEDEVETKTEEINTTTAVGAMAPAIMKKKNSDSDEEEEDMAKITKKEELQNTPEEVTKAENDEEEVVDENEIKDDTVLKEEYTDDMNKIVEALETLKGDYASLKEELDALKNQATDDPEEEVLKEEVPEEVAKEDEEVISESEETTDEVAPEEKAVVEETSDIEVEDEEKVEEPIPPKTERSKLNKSLKENKEDEPEMDYKEAMSGFVKERLRI
jgi:phage head maturation protease